MNESSNVVTWTKVAVVVGLAAAAIYPLLIFVPMPEILTVLLAAAFGPLLSVGALGQYHFFGAYRRTVSLQIAVLFWVIAGTIVNTMLVVQMTVRDYWRKEVAAAADAESAELLTTAYLAVDKIQLGLDISWDFYVAVGTVLLAVNMLHHPRFGRVIGAAGILIGVALLSFNLATFPVPPAEAGSIDLGPALGLWGLAVAVMMARSIGWLREQGLQAA